MLRWDALFYEMHFEITRGVFEETPGFESSLCCNKSDRISMMLSGGKSFGEAIAMLATWTASVTKRCAQVSTGVCAATLTSSPSAFSVICKASRITCSVSVYRRAHSGVGMQKVTPDGRADLSPDEVWNSLIGGVPLVQESDYGGV